MFKNIKKKLKAFMTSKSGFSLIELIVVIAIMAVMAAVLAPALLGYVEKSRMQKDDSAMDEVVNAMQLSLADQEIYDEVLEHSVWDNVSCYIDQKEESKFASHKVTLKAEHGDKKEQYMFGDDARLLDETVYYAAGNMRGLTITFSPSKSGDTYDFANGILNKFVGRKTGILSENPELYNRLRSVIGDKLDTTSQTYRNSDYTIFIRVGSTGGSEAVMQDAIQVWGQFNGTNLVEKDHKFELSSGRVVGAAGQNDTDKNQYNNEINDNSILSETHQKLNPTEVIPTGGTYIRKNGEVLKAGDNFPEPEQGDFYTSGDYEYGYAQNYTYGSWNNVQSMNWGVRVVDKTKTSYGDILESVDGHPIVILDQLFYRCENLEVSPKLPSTARSMSLAYFACTSLKEAPVIPESVTNLHHAFSYCESLQKAPIIPKNVTNFGYAFCGCTSLTGSITINANPNNYSSSLTDTKITEVLGETRYKTEILATK